MVSFKRHNVPSPCLGSKNVLPVSNRHLSRESWLKAAADGLRPLFKTVSHPLPDAIRFSIGFPSTGRKGKRIGECWHSSASADATHEIFIRADLSEPPAVLGVLVHELVHAALPADAAHGPQYRALALAIGLEGKMLSATPGPVLAARLVVLADELGPLPHAKLNLEGGAADRPKKQGTRLLKATCLDKECGYTVRVTSKWVREVGPPHCPKHGAMHVDMPPDEEGEEE